MKQNRFQILILAVLGMSCMMSSCNYAKHIPKGETLYEGSKVIITDDDANSKEKKILREDLEGVIKPKPNKTFLKWKYKLSFYNLIDTPKSEKGLRQWLRNTFAEAPVLGSSFDADANRSLMENVLQNRGFFRAKVFAEEEVDSLQTKGIFHVATRSQAIIDSVEFMQDPTLLSRQIILSSNKTLLKKGQPYNLELIKGERERIDKHLKEKGYYFFIPDYIIVLVDSTIGDNKVWMRVTTKKDEVPDEALKRYRIHNVTIYPNYTLSELSRDTLKMNADTIEGFAVVQREKNFKPSLFVNTMMFRPGSLYNRTAQNSSISRIINLGAFKFAKNRFEVVQDTITPLLNVFYYLTPAAKKSLSVELGGSSRNDSRVGTDLAASWSNRNTMRGSEMWKVKVYGGFETQYGGNAATKRPNTYRYGIETSLTFPRFVVPFIHPSTHSPFVPRTIIKASFDQEIRVKAYKIDAFKVSYGYNWKEDIRKDHVLNPININYVRTDSSISKNPLTQYNYSNLVFNGLIIGPTYDFTYNSQQAIIRRSNIYFNGSIDLSNNILGLAQKADYQTNEQKILGVSYAQYAKFSTDIRHYLKLSPVFENMFANRFFIGVGFPYGNSSHMPNIKQFFSGGNSSLRGFRSRLVGPGTYNELYINGGRQRQFIETLGDIKLELNSEVRGGLYKFIKGAVFFDAGNIWLMNDHPNFPGGKFTSNFYKEFAADLGVGLRFDFSILMLRFDLGMPIRKPWLPDGERWVFNKMNFSDRTWRRDNLILNIAIGTPF